MDLFAHQAERSQLGQPLAERVRPRVLEEMVGQEHLLAPGKSLRVALDKKALPSLILWGPPGTGKTTLARLIARHIGAHFRTLSAVASGVKELRETIAAAKEQRDQYGRLTVLFVDEIHRFNKAQQDALLPDVEHGTVIFIGATTENPSFALNAALLSRSRVLELKPLSPDALKDVLRRALTTDQQLVARKLKVSDPMLVLMAHLADGDARRALSLLEATAAHVAEGATIEAADVRNIIEHPTLRFDRDGDEHYDVISAFIKSLRGSDPDAAIYWLARLLEAGEDPLFVVRRMIIFSSEDIGNADPQALVVAVAAAEAVRTVGMPEGYLPLSQAVLYLAHAPKSNAALTAYQAAKEAVHETGTLPVPIHLRNAPTALARAQGHGKDYRYPHDHPGSRVEQQYLPDALVGRKLVTPQK
jgi:putative ATPase